MLGFRYLADAFVRGLLRRRPPRMETFDEQYPARRQRVEQVCHVILRVGIPPDPQRFEYTDAPHLHHAEGEIRPYVTYIRQRTESVFALRSSRQQARSRTIEALRITNGAHFVAEFEREIGHAELLNKSIKSDQDTQ